MKRILAGLMAMLATATALAAADAPETPPHAVVPPDDAAAPQAGSDPPVRMAPAGVLPIVDDPPDASRTRRLGVAFGF